MDTTDDDITQKKDMKWSGTFEELCSYLRLKNKDELDIKIIKCVLQHKNGLIRDNAHEHIADKSTNVMVEVERFSALSMTYGFIISVLFDINLTDTNEITNKIKSRLLELYGVPTETIYKIDNRTSHHYKYQNSIIWEFDDYRSEENRVSLKNNLICSNCSLKSECLEGAYALRLSMDGSFRPCLKRTDNIISIEGKGEEKL